MDYDIKRFTEMASSEIISQSSAETRKAYDMGLMDALGCYEEEVTGLPDTGPAEFVMALDKRLLTLRQEGRTETQHKGHYDLGVLAFAEIYSLLPIPRDTEVVAAIKKDYRESTK